MTHIWADRIRETSSSTGTDDFTLAGPVTNFREFGDVMSNGDTCFYFAVLEGGGWESGIGTKGTGTLERTTVLMTSAGNTSKLSFGAGAKDVFLGLPAAYILSKLGGTLAGALNWATAATVASATTADIGAAASNFVSITGTTTITGLGTIAAGAMRWVKFGGALTLTHNGTSLILPGGANITTAAGDTAVFVSEGSGNWRCLGYQRANGGIITQAAASDFWAGTSVSKPTTPKTIADAGALVSLTSGTTINTDGSAGQNFMVTLDHNATFAAPTNLIDGKVYTWIIKQGSTGGTGAFNAAFEFPSAPTLSTGAGKYDIVSAVYCAADSKLIARFSKGS
ncbi:MAG: hypothetical protein WC026_16985 [Hyphomicrobium sp.]|uniref:hypothetical protein n=1 Tax=Hyphomicrobium sp. TaxID=82 RepID=UPI0035617F4E